MSKAFLCIILAVSVLTGAGGFFGTSLLLAGDGSSGFAIQDNTGFVPGSFSWDNPQSTPYEYDRFLAGKYVREDGNAVLYIDYPGSLIFLDLEYFDYELFASASAGRSQYRHQGEAFYFPGYNGTLATDEFASTQFEYVREGVLKIETFDLSSAYVLPDGLYYIERAKYRITPRVSGPGDPGNNNGGFIPPGGGTPTPTPGGEVPPNGDGPVPPNVVTTPPPGVVTTPPGGQDQPLVGGHLCSPEGAFQTMVLLFQNEDYYSNRIIQQSYASNEFDTVFNYYTENGALLAAMRGDLDAMAADTAEMWAGEFGLGRSETDAFVRDMMWAAIQWFQQFKYQIQGVDYESADTAYLNIVVTQRVEFDFRKFMDYTVMETVMSNYEAFMTMDDQAIANYIFEMVKDYLFNPWDYGDVAQTNLSYRIRAVKISNGCWAIDNRQDFDATDMFFAFEDDGFRYF